MKFSEMTKYEKRRRVLRIAFGVCAAITVCFFGVLFVKEQVYQHQVASAASDVRFGLRFYPLLTAFFLVVFGDVFVGAGYFLAEGKRPLFTVMNAYALVCALGTLALVAWDVVTAWDADLFPLRRDIALVWAWAVTANVILRFLYFVLRASDGSGKKSEKSS